MSDGTDAGKADAVLVNAHLDSTLPSPGAADDALAVGVMLECIRVLTHTPGWEPKHAIIFCEHLYSQQCGQPLMPLRSVQPRRRVLTRRIATILNPALYTLNVSNFSAYYFGYTDEA